MLSKRISILMVLLLTAFPSMASVNKGEPLYSLGGYLTGFLETVFEVVNELAEKVLDQFGSEELIEPDDPPEEPVEEIIGSPVPIG